MAGQVRGDSGGTNVDVSALQQQLTRELQQMIEDTVGAVCSELQDVLSL